MTQERFDQRRVDFVKAVSRLEEACAQAENSFIRGLAVKAESWVE
jgi:hypothetical protein